jgi:biotin operon repressor
MKKTLPDHLIKRFTELTNDIENAIRADERIKIHARVKKAIRNGTFPVAEFGKTQAVGMNTGMHGESLAGNSHPAAGGVVPFTRSHRQMLGYLEKGYIAVPTLAGHLNVKKQTVYDYMQHLKRAGYDIQSRNTGNNRGGYNKIYRLAKSA